MLDDLIVSDSMIVRDALAEHYLTQGLAPDGGANDRWFRVRIGPVSFGLPNPPARRRAVLLHDVNHLVTGYNTSFGEGEIAIAAFEVGAGCGRFAIVWFINLNMFAIGLMLRPRTVLHAFRRGRHSVSIYRDPPTSDGLATMTVAHVRQHLALDAQAAAARWPDRLVFATWALAASAVLLAPLVVILSVAWLGLRTLTV